MGNCLQRNKLMSQVHQAEEEDTVSKHSCDYLKEEIKEEEKPASVNGKKVKIVLSKEELDWLMLELNNGGSAKKIEDALAEIQRSRGSPLKPVNVVFDLDDEGDEDYEDEDDDESSNCWRPSLDSIPEEEEEEEEEESER